MTALAISSFLWVYLHPTRELRRHYCFLFLRTQEDVPPGVLSLLSVRIKWKYLDLNDISFTAFFSWKKILVKCFEMFHFYYLDSTSLSLARICKQVLCQFFAIFCQFCNTSNNIFMVLSCVQTSWRPFVVPQTILLGSLFCFYTSWYHQQTYDFLMISGRIEREEKYL